MSLVFLLIAMRIIYFLSVQPCLINLVSGGFFVVFSFVIYLTHTHRGPCLTHLLPLPLELFLGPVGVEDPPAKSEVRGLVLSPQEVRSPGTQGEHVLTELLRGGHLLLRTPHVVLRRLLPALVRDTSAKQQNHNQTAAVSRKPQVIPGTPSLFFILR